MTENDPTAFSEIDFDSLPIVSVVARREGGKWVMTMCTSWQTVRVSVEGDFGEALEMAAQRIYDGENDEPSSLMVH